MILEITHALLAETSVNNVKNLQATVKLVKIRVSPS
jgi:hypothetical protein